ncbi:cell surface protein SprA [Reichenbachiella sp. MALMAid0571]|uniref:T9SS outer membrane translocon Sov/SprA n=1 Tax=Reichenbachiella sp. MALMAid0571 TaxID=3143939 RepID=UPI0032DEF9E6
MFFQQPDSVLTDSTKTDSLKNQPYVPSKRPTFIQQDRFGDPFSNRSSRSPLLLQDPTSLNLDVEIDTGMNYTIYEKIGDLNYRPMSTMTFDEFKNYQDGQMIKSYWKEKSSGLDGESAVSGRSLLPKLFVSPVFDRIFGGTYVDIQPNGYLNLDFGGRWQKVENPSIPIRQQKTGGFNYNQQISMNVTGKIGEKLSISANFDNNNSFDFQNNLKVEYTGYEEDIIKKIEVGNVSMPISNSLITGGQSLFGLKTQLQFGKLFVTAVASRQQGRSEVLNIPSGFQGKEFEVRASDYDENKHFFLGHFFRDNYEKWLSRLPQIVSGVNVTRVEVYILNRNNETQTLRNIAALMDLGEGSKVHNQNVSGRVPGPSNNAANNLYEELAVSKVPEIRNIETAADYLASTYSMSKSTDFETITAARKLDPREYTWNSKLGYISLLRKLQNDEFLAVSYEYTYNGQRYQVGELSEDYQVRQDDDLILLKLLRPTKINTKVPSWDLMMKNVYYLNAYRLSEDGFTLRIHYRDDLINFDNPSLNQGAETKDIPLVRLLGLDQLNKNGDRQRDGNFDFIEGVTVDKEHGNIMFPVLEPFGRTLESHFRDDEQTLVNKYVYDTLYRTTQVAAQQVASKNKYFIKGSFQSGSASEIRLEGINIDEESVHVSAGGTQLTKGLHYTVDGRLGVVRIIDDGILNSGKDLQISYEKADLFNFQTRWLTGAHFDYRFNDNFNLGATILHLNERPGGISRYSVGDEPLKNTKYGFDLNYQKESRFLTKMIDALPILNTKEKSTFSFNGEFAQIIPGTSNVVDGEGTSYIDDFENAATPINIAGGHIPWKLAATPETTNNKFKVENGIDNLGYGYKRAKLAWYIIDNTFYRSVGGNRPDNIRDEDLANHYVRPILPQEIFKQRDLQIVNTNEPIFDLAYYPSERGAYNYNPNLTADGFLKNPEQNFGGITRANTNEVNWNKTNVEYLEFWMMDPFIQGPNGRVLDGNTNLNNSTGGELIFNFGSISEDLMKDNRHAFENGLPADGSFENTTSTEWGKVTTLQYLTDFFDNSANARPNQDVGFDGLKSSEEASFFDSGNRWSNILNNNGRDRVLNDVSADDFKYFLDPEYDNRDAKILERYKNFNGTENNSPLNAGSGSYTASSSNTPENEDLNNDNTISDVEEYFEYKIPLTPGGLGIGKGHIIDQVTVEENGTDVNWYLFRIPVRNPDNIFGNPTFESIKFYRMYLTGWRQPVVLRFAELQLVGSQWRKSEENLKKSGFSEIPETTTSDFDVSVVNIEENGTAVDGKSPYVVPPGLKRDLDNTTTIQRRNNEQSLRICVEDLEDGDARGVYKLAGLDLLSYGSIKMFLHAEPNGDSFLEDDEVTAFLRFGSDFVENYYEIEVPLKITPNGLTGSEIDIDRLIWPEENEIDIAIDELYALKSLRDREDHNLEQPFTIPYDGEDGKHYNLTIEGNPKMSSVQTLMIGVRNPKSTDPDVDDGQEKSICIWANELRVSDFNTTKGWAANARMSAQLADFARVNASTRYTSIGFGSIQQRISERTRDETFQYDISADINLDKLIPGKHGIKIPMYISTEKTVATPQYDPLDQDLPLDATLLSFSSEQERQEYKAKVQERSTRKAINFSNVRKEKVNPEAKTHIYDIENFSFSYAFSESVTSNINTAAYVEKNYRGGFAYNFSPSPTPIEPFKNVGFLDGNYLKLIKDFNFTPLPNNLSMRAEVDRRFTKRQLRNSDLSTDGIDPYFEKYFNFNRSYALRWNLTKSLSLNYSARARAIVDEPEGDLDSQAKKDSVMYNLQHLGRMKNFDQSMGATYRLPFDKIPLTDWISADLGFDVGYNWNGGSIDQLEEFGNIISNNRDRSATGKVDMVKLYNKIGFLKEINTPKRSSTSRRSQQPTVKKDTVKQSGGGLIKSVLRMAMSLRSINVNYSIRESTVLPGFRPRAYLFGLDSGLNAPGTSFIFGSQDPEIRFRAAENGWLVKSPFLTSSFTQSLSEDLGLKANIEPFKDLKIQLDMKRTNSGDFQEIFRYDSLTTEYNSLTPTRSGSYSISFFSLKTAFVKDNAENISPTFSEFESYREIVQGRLNSYNKAGEYSLNSQDVLIPAFIAAYSGRDPNTISLTPFPKIPLPNWRIDYAGLKDLPMFKDLVSSINLTHSYTSTFRINNYTNSLLYDNAIELSNHITNYPSPTLSNDNGLIPVYILNEVSIAERFSPLIGVNVRTKNRSSAKIEWKKERTMALNLSNSQVTEVRSSDISFDFGTTKKDWKIPFKVQGRTISIKNDVTFRMTFTVRDTKTIQRKIDDVTTITAGNINYQLRPTVNYVANEKLNITMYFERNINQPRVSNSYNRATTAFGVQMRFSLAQ